MRKYDTVFILSSFSFSTVHMNIFSLTLHFTVRNISGLCSLLHVTFSHSFFNYNLISITYLCTFTLCLPLFVPLQIISCFIPQFPSHCHFWYVYQPLYVHHFILFFAHTPLTIFLSLVCLLYVKLVLHIVPPLHHFFTVTNIPSFCSVVHLSCFSVHATFELPTAVLPGSDLLETKHSITSQGSSLFTFKLHYTSISWVLYSLPSEMFLTFIVSLSTLQSSSTWCCDLGHYMHALCLTSL
jgi:hypothetical protein